MIGPRAACEPCSVVVGVDGAAVPRSVSSPGNGALAIVAAGTALTLLAAAQQQPRRKPGGAATKRTDEAGAPRDTAPAAKENKDAGGGAVLEQRTVDGGARVFRFGEVEVEGRLKSPQIVYFLRRVRAEFAAGDLGHRPFTSELSETRNESSF